MAAFAKSWRGRASCLSQVAIAISFASSALAPKNFAASVNYLTLGLRRVCDPLFRQAQCEAEGVQMRAWMGIAIVVAIGLIWSVAAMSKLVPLDGSEMRSAAISAE